MPEERKTNNELLEQAKKRFKLVQETESEQRQREKDDLRFQVPEEQWDAAARRQREGDPANGVPARPILSISKIDQPIQLVLNQERSAKLSVGIDPLSPEAGKEVAVILEGIYRRIERDSEAQSVRSWGFDRAAKAGRGYWRVGTQYDEASDNPTDQVITIERILYQESVYLDPAATKSTDAEWGFITAWVPLDVFKREYPDAETMPGEALTWADLVQEEPDWVRGEGEDAAVLVCEYFYRVHDLQEVGPKGNRRKKDMITVKWAKMSGFEVLEEGDWNGKYIPIVQCVGRELQPYDGKRRWIGIIGPAKDGQRLYNYAASSAVEIAALEPKAPWVGAEGQFAGHPEWDESNTRNFPYLEYRPVTHEGNLAPAPQRSQVDVGRLGPSMQLLQQADGFLQATTFTHDPSLGRFSDREKSGRAILALQQQGEAGTSHYMSNLSDAIRDEARIILNLIPAVYDRPGRQVQVLDDEGESETVMLNQPFYKDREKRPVPLGPGQQPPPPPMPQGAPPMAPGAPPPMPPAPPEVKHYDLRKGIYSVAVTIGKQRQTAMQEGAEELGQLLQARPELMPLLGPLYFEYRQFPSSEKIGDLLKKMRDKQWPFLAEDDDGQPTPEQMRTQIDQMGQQLQMMGAQLQAAIKAVETQEAKQQAMLQKAELDNQTKLKIAEMDNQTKLILESVTGEMKQQQETLKQIQEALKLRHESTEKDRDREHEVGMVLTEAAVKPLTEPPDLEYRGEAEGPLEGDEQ